MSATQKSVENGAKDGGLNGEALGAARPRLDLVQCFEGDVWERDWYGSALADFDVQLHRSPDFSLIIPDALYMVRGSLGLGVMPKTFLEAVKRAGNCGLIHLGDEFLRGPYAAYASFAFVIRTHYATFVESPGVLQIPLGYSNNMQSDMGERSSKRPYAWGFTGAKGLARVQLGRIWSGFEKSFFHLVDLRAGGVHLSRSEFLELLSGSAFVPCPMGNAHLESLRIYEALERGAIPIVSTRAKLAYFDRVLGEGHPIPQFQNWTQARVWAEDIYRRPADLDVLQERVITWWAAKKLDVRERVRVFVEEGLAGAHRAELARKFARGSNLAGQPARLVELFRHHDAITMVGRAQITLRRALKAAGAGNLGGS